MCGITGFLKFKYTKSIDFNKTDLIEMTNSLTHRGPDNQDIWIENNVFLGHTRLSILDLSRHGDQPMISKSKRYVISFNGEIYNYKELKKKLLCKNIKWKGNSDTEVFLECIEVFGIKKTLNLSRGMFAFALWDKKKKQLTLARDRVGEKPLYYGSIKGHFVFSSELKAIKCLRKYGLEKCPDAMNLMLRFGYIPAPYCIYKNIFKLHPGNMIIINENKFYNAPVKWWDDNNIFKRNNLDNNPEPQEIDLHKVLKDAVKEQMVSDVPIGALLSGGIDSSLIVSLMQAQSSEKINTFTIGFLESDYNEAQYAKEVSKVLGTQHHELYVSPKQAIDLIPKIPNIYDEPFGDSSQIPTLLISELTSNHVKVCLTGDGGDELFGGYNRYLWANQILKIFDNIPKSLRNLISSSCYFLSAEDWTKLFNIIYRSLPFNTKINNIGDKIHKMGELINYENKEDLYFKMISQWRSEIPSSHQFNTASFFNKMTDWNKNLTYIDNMMKIDIKTYLPDDILVKVDRASMSYGLETRVPFLDSRVIEMAWQMPLNKMIIEKRGKMPLRNILKKYIPENLIERPKQGFSIPIDVWLRGSLKEWAENLLDEKKLKDTDFFNSSLIRKRWDEHLNGKHNWHAPLWNVLMMQAWLENN